MRLLLIQDEAAGENLGCALISAGFVVDVAETGEDGLNLCSALEYDAIVLDLCAPGQGHQALRQLRRAEIRTPAIVLTTEPPIDAAGLWTVEAIARPFEFRELAARIRAVVRRARGFYCRPVIYTGRLMLDVVAKTAKVDGRPIALSTREYAILELLSLHRGRLVSRVRLLGHLHDGITAPDTRTLALHLRQLQRKLDGACGGESYIQTFRCGGIVLREPDRDVHLMAA